MFLAMLDIVSNYMVMFTWAYSGYEGSLILAASVAVVIIGGGLFTFSVVGQMHNLGDLHVCYTFFNYVLSLFGFGAMLGMSLSYFKHHKITHLQFMKIWQVHAVGSVPVACIMLFVLILGREEYRTGYDGILLCAAIGSSLLAFGHGVVNLWYMLVLDDHLDRRRFYHLYIYFIHCMTEILYRTGGFAFFLWEFWGTNR